MLGGPIACHDQCQVGPAGQGTVSALSVLGYALSPDLGPGQQAIPIPGVRTLYVDYGAQAPFYPNGYDPGGVQTADGRAFYLQVTGGMPSVSVASGQICDTEGYPGSC